MALYGPARSTYAAETRNWAGNDTQLRYLFAGFSRPDHAEAMVTRFNTIPAATFDWLKFDIFTRTGLTYDRDDSGALVAVAPLYGEPIKASLGRPDPPPSGAPSRQISRSRPDDDQYDRSSRRLDAPDQ